MWLLPLFPRLAGLATAIFYRTTVAGARIPPTGPLLLVGNHPNSLLDPLFLAAVARRPVRFLAKAPLFADPRTAWAVRAVGAIPVYRPSDDPTLVRQNADMFRAAHDALRDGAAVGIFPEGKSHDGPSLVPLRTGAARIALGAHALLGAPIPIVPVGLVFRNKDEFRSEAHVVVGEAVSWDGMGGSAADPEDVKELTARIDRGLRAVTLNLEQWEDSDVISLAEEIFVAEQGAGLEQTNRVDRWREAALVLSAARSEKSSATAQLARDIRRHGKLLRLFGMRPIDLHGTTSSRAAATWATRRLTLPIEATVAWLGAALFWVPYRLTGATADSMSDENSRASVKLVVGAAFFTIWIALLSAASLAAFGWQAGAAAVVALPVLALATVMFLERAREAWGDARRFFLLRSRATVVEELRSRQRDLQLRLQALRERASAARA